MFAQCDLSVSPAVSSSPAPDGRAISLVPPLTPEEQLEHAHMMSRQPMGEGEAEVAQAPGRDDGHRQPRSSDAPLSHLQLRDGQVTLTSRPLCGFPVQVSLSFRRPVAQPSLERTVKHTSLCVVFSIFCCVSQFNVKLPNLVVTGVAWNVHVSSRSVCDFLIDPVVHCGRGQRRRRRRGGRGGLQSWRRSSSALFHRSLQLCGR